MAKITLNIEFDDVAELREFMRGDPAAVIVQQLAAPTAESEQEESVEQATAKRKRRTKAEILAAQQAAEEAQAAEQEDRPVVREEVEKEVVVVMDEVEVLPPVQPTVNVPNVPNFNLGGGIPAFNAQPAPSIITMQPTIAITQPAEQPTSPLPSDLLSALGGA